MTPDNIVTQYFAIPLVESLRYISESGEIFSQVPTQGLNANHIVAIITALGVIITAIVGVKYLKERVGELKEEFGKMKENVIYRSTCEKCESNTQEQLKVIKEDIREVKDTGNHTHDAVIEMSTKFELFMQNNK